MRWTEGENEGLQLYLHQSVHIHFNFDCTYCHRQSCQQNTHDFVRRKNNLKKHKNPTLIWLLSHFLLIE